MVADHKSRTDHGASKNARPAHTSRIVRVRQWLRENPHSRFLLFASLCVAMVGLLVAVVTFGPEAPTDPRPVLHAAGTQSVRGSSGSVLATPSTGQASSRRGLVVASLIENVLTNDFENAEDVVTGRFQRRFSEQLADLGKVDTSEMRALRRGRDWVLVEARYVERPGPSTGHWREDARPAGLARLRFVRSDGEWKVEDVRLIPGKDDGGEEIQDALEARQNLSFFEEWQATRADPVQEP